MPALAVVGLSDLLIVTSSELELQGAFAIVHRNTLFPTPKFVTPDVGLFGEVIVPLPLTNVHVPVPTVAVFPANVAVVAQTD